MQPNFKMPGKHATWTNLGPNKTSAIRVKIDGEVTLGEVAYDANTGMYHDLPEVSGIPAIRYAEEHIGNDFMKIAVEAMK